MRSITAALIVVAAVSLVTATSFRGRQAPAALVTETVAAATLLEPVATIPLDVIPSAFVATPGQLWATAGIEGVIRIDADTGRIRGRIHTDGAVIAALADGAVWAVDVANDRLLELDRRQNRVEREVRVSGLPTGVAAAEGRLWVVGQEHASVTVVDARSLSSVAVLRFAPAELWPAGIVAGPRGIWLITGWRGEVSLIDPTTLEVVARVPTPHLDALAATAGAVWGSRAGDERAGLVRVDPWSLVADIVDLDDDQPVTALSGGDDLHVAVPGALLELDARTGETLTRVRISRRYRITALASVGRDLWAADEASGALLRFRLSPG
jgi:hypothetical protein